MQSAYFSPRTVSASGVLHKHTLARWGALSGSTRLAPRNKRQNFFHSSSLFFSSSEHTRSVSSDPVHNLSCSFSPQRVVTLVVCVSVDYWTVWRYTEPLYFLGGWSFCFLVNRSQIKGRHQVFGLEFPFRWTRLDGLVVDGVIFLIPLLRPLAGEVGEKPWQTNILSCLACRLLRGKVVCTGSIYMCV